MAEPEAPRIEAALDAWLAPFLEVLGRKTRRRWAPLYLHGLLGPDGRKSLQPLAARLGLKGHDRLQHFVASPAWDDAPLRRVLAGKADALVGGSGAIDRAAVDGGRRHRPAEGGQALGRGGAAVLRGLGQARQLPGPGLAHPGPR